jgi:CBS domain-containing protein
MGTVQTTDMKAELTELSATAMDAFCQDISGMFDVEMTCRQQDGCMETVGGLRKRFKNITAIVSAKAKGHLDGLFHLIVDLEGLFTLAGTIVMQPRQKIIENRKKGTLAEADDLRDAMKEGGNLLIGSWNRVCIDKWGNSNHLLQTNTFIGKPWDNPHESMNAAENEDFLYIPCEMTIGDYPVFKCGVIFPKLIMTPASQAGAGEGDAGGKEKQPESLTPPKAAAEEKPAEVKDKPAAASDSKPQPKTESPVVTDGKPVLKSVQDAVLESSENLTIPKIAPRITSEGQGILWELCARDVMRKSVVWCESDESVEQVRIKMDKNDVSYVIAGTGGAMEGIIARSDLTAAMSPYLRPVFAQWRRPIDEASLQIKVKWVMSKSVHIVRPEKPLAIVMENMCRFGVRALPVVDQQGKVEGLITVFDIFKSLLQKNDDVLITTKTA